MSMQNTSPSAALVMVGNENDEDIISVSSSKGSEHSKACTSSSDQDPSSLQERDEIKEVQKMAQKDTKSVNQSRLAATFVLLVTAFCVTFATYILLKSDETKNFETAFDQFSRSLSDAAVSQQRDLRNGLDQLGTFISVWANSDHNNESFPFVTLPDFETIGPNILQQAHIETVMFNPFVRNYQREAWMEYADANKGWVYESHMTQMGNLSRLVRGEESFNKNITAITAEGIQSDSEDRDFYLPSWFYSPPPATFGFVNLNIARIAPTLVDSWLILQNETLFTPVMAHPGIPLAFSREEHAIYHSKLADSSVENPHSFFCHPVYDKPGDKTSGVVGALAGAAAWDAAFLGLLPDGVDGIYIVIQNTCNQTYSYEIFGSNAVYRGPFDDHEGKFDAMQVYVNLALHTHPGFNGAPGHCRYSMRIYPTKLFKESYDTNAPEIFACVVASTFLFVAVAIYMYDRMQHKRNINLVSKAAQSNSIVASLFPDTIRERLFKQAEENQASSGSLSSFLIDGKAEISSQPMADLFLDTTVLIADISGFTSWSSVREPTQVFILLENVYSAFDQIAKRRHVFKVEAGGDCYVAVTGLPHPRSDHAIVMVKFASDIIRKMHTLTKELEIQLGPGTGDLDLRVGVHSGPVTAGVLRGERARFQLFGDTVNTASRMKSSGRPSFIHCSKETSELLRQAGKDSWVEKNPDMVNLKGKGTVETYWVTIGNGRAGSIVSANMENDDLLASSTFGTPFPNLDEKTCRLIDWNTENLLRLLKQIVAQRTASVKSFGRMRKSTSRDFTALDFVPQGTPLAEVKEIIHLPEFDGNSSVKSTDFESVEIPKEVVEQLHHLVSVLSSLYNDNPFHNFQHASHVVMSVTKLMSRIVASSNDTYGITSPITQFACVFSALIHDVDHVGVSNAQLVTEEVLIAAKYNQRSVAEQNSLDLSWGLLMSPAYEKFRAYLLPTKTAQVRFRQLVVNSVMATDIVDKELKELRNSRWDKAFKDDVTEASVEKDPSRDDVNRKATIVIEHIIQASDISHTMQHWHVYRKWNQCLFEELYVAYLNGRMEKDPSTFWYKGEFGFFDFYIIPLTQKLKDCGVFGVSSGELLSYARNNRMEWEQKGEAVVAEMTAECQSKYGVKGAVKARCGVKLPRGDSNVTHNEYFENEEVMV